MKRLLSAAVATACLSIAANAQVIAPAEGKVDKLGPLTVVTYYIPATDGFHVVVTINKTDGDQASVARVTGVLNNGQRMLVSVPRASGTSPPAARSRTAR